MEEDSKFDGRRERSRRTRARIVEAAAIQFVNRGFVATTIEDIADHAGVAVQTVYYIFGTKTKVLAAVLDVTIGGDVEPVPVLQRAWVESLRAEPDATAAVQRLIEVTAAILARTAPIYEVVRRAAADPDVATLLDETRRRRRHDQRDLVEMLWQAGHLRPGLDPGTAADIVYAVMNEDVFQALTQDCGWSGDQFRAWATEFMGHQLLDADATRTPSKARRSRSTPRRTPA